MTNQPGIEPDTKDWTWVLEQPCGACGYDASAVALTDLPARIRADTAGWSDRLGAEDARTRPDPGTWSPLEYACHVRDVHRVFAGRVHLMLAHVDPQFPNWDQDVTAAEGDYAGQDPRTVLAELAQSADLVATAYAGVPDDAWQRRGFRSNGSVFTIASLGRYHLHDVVHHAWDVGTRDA